MSAARVSCRQSLSAPAPGCNTARFEDGQVGSPSTSIPLTEGRVQVEIPDRTARPEQPTRLQQSGALFCLYTVNHRIDAHVHVWTDRRDLYPRAAGTRHYPPERFTPEDFLSHVRPSGITRAVLVQMSFYGFDNSYMLDAIKAHPDVFSGIAVVDSAAADLDVAMRSLAAKGIRGFRISPVESSAGRLDAPGMTSMWRTGADRRIAMCLLIDPEMLPDVASMCERFPDTPVVIDHLARIGVDGQIRDSDTRSLCSLAKYGSVFVNVSAFYALGRKQAPYTDLAPLIRARGVWQP